MITLKNLHEASEEAVYRQIRDHLLSQMRKSEIMLENTKDCAYRGENGLKCAAGCLIGDDEYRPEFDTKWSDTTWLTLVEKGYAPPNHKHLIRDLQKIHDLYEPSQWREKLDELGRSRGFFGDF